MLPSAVRSNALFATLIIAASCLTPRLAAAAPNCEGDSTGFLPLIDLGAGLYQGAEGGLYTGGFNTRPVLHDAAGRTIANAISPVDTFGSPDPSGKIVLNERHLRRPPRLSMPLTSVRMRPIPHRKSWEAPGRSRPSRCGRLAERPGRDAARPDRP